MFWFFLPMQTVRDVKVALYRRPWDLDRKEPRLGENPSSVFAINVVFGDQVLKGETMTLEECGVKERSELGFFVDNDGTAHKRNYFEFGNEFEEDPKPGDGMEAEY